MIDQSRNDAVYLRGVADGIIQIIPDELARIADEIERLTKERDELLQGGRKVIQVATAVAPATYGEHPLYSQTVVLCDDDTIWELVETNKWERLPPIPGSATDG